jgi:hypothetical protein
VEIGGVFHDTLADFEGEVEPGEAGIAVLESLNDAQGVMVMIETLAEALHLAVEFFLAGMGVGRVADVVNQGQGLGKIAVQAQDTEATVRATWDTSMVCVRRFRK